MDKTPLVNIDILVIKDNQVLLGLLSDKWNKSDKPLYGVPGRDIIFGETIGDTVKRNLKEEFDCTVSKYEIFSVNANYEFGNHYIGIGVVVELEGEIEHLLKEDWDEWKWFDLNQIPETLFAPAKNAIESYKQNRVCISE